MKKKGVSNLQGCLRWHLLLSICFFGLLFQPVSAATSYLFATMDDTVEGLYLFNSLDGVNFDPIIQGRAYAPTGSFHDPSIMYNTVDGYYYVAYTVAYPDRLNYFKIIKSKDFLIWLDVATVTLPDYDQAWAPEWFNDNGSWYIFVTGVTAGYAMQINVLNPTSADFSAWSPPRLVAGAGFPTKMIDSFVVKIGGTYNLFYQDNDSAYICLARSSARESGYTVVKTGNWTGIGQAQGPCLVKLPNGNYRLYGDSYSIVNSQKIIYNDTADFVTWGTAQYTNVAYPASYYPVGHGTVLAIHTVETATVILGNLTAIYDGTPKAATAITDPVGLSVTFAYNGSATPPSVPGRYTVSCTVADPDFQGSATGTLVITSATLTNFRIANGLATDGSQDLLKPAGDGVYNLQKYAFNMIGTEPGQSLTLNIPNHATVGSSGNAGLPTLKVSESGALIMTYIRRKASTFPGVIYSVEYSTDLTIASWATDASTTESVTSIDSNFERVTVTKDVMGVTQYFGRVRVTLP